MSETFGEAINRLAREEAAKIVSVQDALMFSKQSDDLSTKWPILAEKALNILAAEVERLQLRINSAPLAMMDTRDALGVCALKEDDFPALYALQGKKVRLILEDKQGE